MPCIPISDPARGVTGVICTRRGRLPPCGCGRPSTRQCDGKVPGARGRSRRCDRAICDGCATPIGENLDHCPSCRDAATPQRVPEGALVAYCDGSGTVAHLPCGAGVVVYDGGRSVLEASRHLGLGTNNHAELSAVRVALFITAGPDLASRPLVIRTDSMYVISSLTAPEPPEEHRPNAQLVGIVRRALRGRAVRFEHVKGHAGEPGNERADRLAGLARLRGKP